MQKKVAGRVYQILAQVDQGRTFGVKRVLGVVLDAVL